MNMFLAISTLILCAGTSALGAPSKIDDWTFIGAVDAYATSSKSLTVQEGKAIIDVSALDTNDRITCQFINNGFIMIEQKNTNKCVVHPRFEEALALKITVINSTGKRIDYKIWLREQK